MSAFEKLLEMSKFYQAEAHRYCEGQAWFAASIMQVAALEGLVQASCLFFLVGAEDDPVQGVEIGEPSD